MIIKSTNICFKSVTWGFIVAPLSTGLYSLFFIPYIGIIFIPFLPLSLIFNKPAWWILVEKLEIIEGKNITLINDIFLILINGIIWGILFYIVFCMVRLSQIN